MTAAMTDSSKQKKILHIITGLNDGGAEGVLTRLCLHSKQFQHVVVSLMDSGKYGAVLVGAGIPVRSLNMNPGKPSLFKFFKLISLIKQENPDVIQTWMYHADLFGGVAARVAGIRHVFWGIRNSTLEKGKSKRSTIFVARLCAILSKWVPEKVICCAYKALEVHAEIGYQSSKLLVVPNGYDLEFFKPDLEKRRSVRDELKISEEEFLIGKVGRYDPQKDHFNLLTALSLVSKEVNFRCLLVGKNISLGNHELVARISELGLQNKVILAGQRTDVPAIMNALDLHVLSSSFGEAFPNVIAEAMACGTPCVTTDVGDAMDIVGNSEACCPVGDSPSLANLINKMYGEWRHHPESWSRRKAFCIDRIQTNFSILNMVGNYEDQWLKALHLE